VTATEAAHTDGVKAFTLVVNPSASITPAYATFTMLDGTVLTISEGADAALVADNFTGTTGITTSQTLSFDAGTVGLVNAPATCPGLQIQFKTDSTGALFLRIRNTGLADAYNNGTTLGQGNPVYFTSLTVNAPGRGVLFGSQVGVRETSPGVFTLIAPTDPKHPTRPASLNFAAGPYTASRALHMLDGGEQIYYRFVDSSDLEEADVRPDAQALTDAASVCNVNATRVAAWPFLEHVLELYQHDPVSYADVSYRTAPLVYQTKMTWGNRWFNMGSLAGAIHSSGSISNENTVYTAAGTPHERWLLGGQMLAPMDGTGPRPFIYLTPLGFAIDYMRNSNDDSYLWGLHFMRRKICTAMRAFDTASAKHKGRWVSEDTGVINASGVFPFQVHRVGHSSAGDYGNPTWKMWDEDIAVWRLLAPHDPLIQDAFDRRCAHLLGMAMTWVDNGGASPVGLGSLRPAAHVLLSLWLLRKTCLILGGGYTATAASLKTKAENFIETMFAAQDLCASDGNGDKPFWPPIAGGTSQLPMGGSQVLSTGSVAGLRSLEHWMIAFTKWIADEGTNAGRFAHWKKMCNWWFTYCSGVSSITGTSGGTRRAWCYEVGPNIPGGANSSGAAAVWNLAPTTVTFAGGQTSPNVNGAMLGNWVLCMKSYMEAWYPAGVTPHNRSTMLFDPTITWEAYFDQIARFCFEWNDFSNNPLTPSNTGAINTGNGSFNAPSWACKITGEFIYGACDW
jgi:hypothetical protein